ncbi:G-protein coupled receptor family C group 6 member A [Hypomesus transpacificus]|uniref:G-protein coupled receptor family C group 6 member A n=1 Tax=Hypomesus transpacificus TaxID=137520 RepID=UPI001F08080D|nr:G-protein coupled receptor family C group 6 member A [Hypomesus transpacificus]
MAVSIKAVTCGALAPGDVLIGVLKPCHEKVVDLEKRLGPQRYNCTDFHLLSFVETLAIINTIETINNSGFLPGIRLGYVICDSCAYSSTALKKVQEMLTINDTLPVQCDIVNQPLVKVIIGERYSEVSISVARLLSINMIPQISTTSSAATLDDKLRFPTFLRTIPSDTHQTQALAQLMAHYSWNWVGVVSGDDDYGKAALQSFLKDADDLKICLEFEEVLPQYLNNANIQSRILKVADKIQSSKAKVVLLILKEQVVEQLFKEIIRRGITRIWIASDGWSMSQHLTNINDINMVGGILGFGFITSSPTPGFKDYLKNLTSGPGVVNRLIEEYKDLRFKCTSEAQEQRDCLAKVPPSTCPIPKSLEFKSDLACTLPNAQEANDDFLVDHVNLNLTYRETLATWSIAHALRSLLKCNQSDCPGDTHFPPWKLLQELKRINFTKDGRSFFFDESGNFVNGYDLINWVRDENGRKLEIVGGYNVMKRIVEVEQDNIDWGASNKTPCPPGTAKKIVRIHCCYDCTDCEPGTYSNITNQENCQPCPNNTWSMKGWDHCENRTEDYFKWNDPSAVALLTISGIGFLLLSSVLIILVVGRHSTVFKVAGGKLCFVMIAGLAVSFGAVVLFVGKPTNDICKSRQTMYGLGFTLSVSCILVKAFRTFLAFLTDPVQHHKMKKLYKPPIIIICGTAIQGLICVLWLIFDSPKVVQHTSDQTMYIELQCNEGSNWGFGIMLSYISLLAFICFILALKGRKVPHRYNETGYIIFSMVIYLFVWICFIPIYVTKNQQRSAIQAFAIIVSNSGIIFCHFLPKCYMILCKNKEDISKQTYLERVRIFSITSTDSTFEHMSIDSGAGSMELVPEARLRNSTANLTETGANSVKKVFSTITTIQKFDDLKTIDSSCNIRRRLRTKSI